MLSTISFLHSPSTPSEPYPMLHDDEDDSFSVSCPSTVSDPPVSPNSSFMADFIYLSGRNSSKASYLRLLRKMLASSGNFIVHFCSINIRNCMRFITVQRYFSPTAKKICRIRIPTAMPSIVEATFPHIC